MESEESFHHHFNQNYEQPRTPKMNETIQNFNKIAYQQQQSKSKEELQNTYTDDQSFPEIGTVSFMGKRFVEQSVIDNNSSHYMNNTSYNWIPKIRSTIGEEHPAYVVRDKLTDVKNIGMTS